MMLLPFYRYSLGPDGISYLSIASQYLSGYWQEAVNAYWGPLSSWCLAILLFARVPGLLATRVVSLVLGLFVLFGFRRLCLGFQMRETARTAVMLAASVMMLAFELTASVPDLLLTAVLVNYLGIILNPSYPASRVSGVASGVLGGLAYLAKAYGFFFFAAHFFLFSLAHFFREKGSRRRAEILKQTASGAMIFLLICFAWITTLHAKYGAWMLGTAGEYNHRLAGPESSGYPHLRHLIAPSSEHAVTAWQDPSPEWLPEWSVLSSRSTLEHEGKLAYSNAKALAKFLLHVAPVIVIVGPWYALAGSRRTGKSAELLSLLVTVVLFCAGYVLITVEARYFWLADLLVLLAVFGAADHLLARLSIGERASAAVLAAVFLSFALDPLLWLRTNFRLGRALFEQGSTLRSSVILTGRLASCSHWQDSAYLAYLMGASYWGVPAPVPEADEVAQELNPDYRRNSRMPTHQSTILENLKRSGITFLLVWPDCDAESGRLGHVAWKNGDVSLLKLDR